MSEKQTKRDRQIARCEQQATARQQEAHYRQGELLPARHVVAYEELASSFSGPLPPPEVLLEYDQVLPGLADRIVRMAEAEGDSRRAIHKRIIRLSELGLFSAVLITLAVLWIGWDLIDSGATREGLGSIVIAIAALVVVFITGRRQKAPDPAEE